MTLKQKEEFDTILKTHHDVFAVDNYTFGKCPWLRFRIDTGDNPPINQSARPVPTCIVQIADMQGRYFHTVQV